MAKLTQQRYKKDPDGKRGCLFPFDLLVGTIFVFHLDKVCRAYMGHTGLYSMNNGFGLDTGDFGSMSIGWGSG